MLERPKGKVYHKVDDDGTERWFVGNVLHREDGPAVITRSGAQYWVFNDTHHRTDGPAVIHPYGTERWYFEGMLHRTDGPAEINSSGHKEWWLFDKEYTCMEWLLKVYEMKQNGR